MHMLEWGWILQNVNQRVAKARQNRMGQTARLMGGADAGGKLAGALASDVDDFVVCRGLIEGREQAFRFGDGFVVEVLLDFGKGVIDAEGIVAHGALQIGQVTFLTSDAVEKGEQVFSIGIKRVIECDLVRHGPVVVAKRLLAKIGDALVHVEIQAIEIVELRGEIENFVDQGRIEMNGLRARVLVQLAKIEAARAGMVHFDLGKFRIAGLEYLGVGDLRPGVRRDCASAGRRGGKGEQAVNRQKYEERKVAAPHDVIWTRTAAAPVRSRVRAAGDVAAAMRSRARDN